MVAIYFEIESLRTHILFLCENPTTGGVLFVRRVSTKLELTYIEKYSKFRLNQHTIYDKRFQENFLARTFSSGHNRGCCGGYICWRCLS